VKFIKHILIFQLASVGLFIFSPVELSAQVANSLLTAAHIQKIERIKSPRIKLRQYKIFQRRDSLKLAKINHKKSKREIDSLTLANSIRMYSASPKRTTLGWDNHFKLSRKEYNSLLQQYGKPHAREIRSALNQYAHDIKSYKQKFGQFPLIDSHKDFSLEDASALAKNEATERLSSLTNKGAIAHYQSELNSLKDKQLQYFNETKHLNDSAYIRQQAKEKAEQLAYDYIQNNPLLLKASQSKVNALMKIYSYVPNSNDLSTAVRRTSLKGKTFRERLVLGGNFNIVSIRSVTVDLSPVLGYRVNTDWSFGIGGSARVSADNTVTPFLGESYGYKFFTSYDVIGNFFAFTEFNRNTAGSISTETGNIINWQNSLLMGGGKTLSVTRKVDMTVVALYNFFYEPGNPLYPRPFVVRFGFQLSENALLRRK
jgi:hypothetical protein